MNEQTAKEFLDEYVQTVKDRDGLQETAKFQADRLAHQAEAMYKYFEDTIVRLVYDADRLGVPESKIRDLVQVAQNTVNRIYSEDDE